MFHFFGFNRFLLLLTLLTVSFNITYAAHKKVGVIVPLEHEAMTQIVDGIKESLADMDVEIEVKNAHSDPNIMLALVKQMKDQDIDLIMPIGTSTSQMTISHIKNKPIVCVAAMPDKTKNPLVTGIYDEISISSSLSRMPKINNIAIIYSASEKIAPEIDELKKYALQNGVILHLAMVQTLVELPMSVRSAPDDVQAFLILKDHLICSGINILNQEATKRFIPVISSDEGSVIKGATMAIGVKEKTIGVESGLLAKKILKGVSPGAIPYKTIDILEVFVNTKSMSQQKVITEDDIRALKMSVIHY